MAIIMTPTQRARSSQEIAQNYETQNLKSKYRMAPPVSRKIARKLCGKVMNNKTRKIRWNSSPKSDPRVLLLYIADRKYIRPNSKRPWTVDAILKDASGYLGDEHYMFGLELMCAAEKLPKLTHAELRMLLTKAMTKKYLSRPSPPFSAAPLCGYTLEGNDGAKYTSVKVGQSCVWQKSK